MNELEQKKLLEYLAEIGITDLYMGNQITGLISEIAKGFRRNFVWYPDISYINEKVRNIKSRIEDFQKQE